MQLLKYYIYLAADIDVSYYTIYFNKINYCSFAGEHRTHEVLLVDWCRRLRAVCMILLCGAVGTTN